MAQTDLLAEISQLLLFIGPNEQQLLVHGILLPFLPVVLNDSGRLFLRQWHFLLIPSIVLNAGFILGLLVDAHFFASQVTSKVCTKKNR